MSDLKQFRQFAETELENYDSDIMQVSISESEGDYTFEIKAFINSQLCIGIGNSAGEAMQSLRADHLVNEIAREREIEQFVLDTF